MFSRRTPLSITQKIREAVWPSMGWGRFLKYTQLRLIRLKDSNRAIATGLAFGASISFVPLPGTHIITAGFWAWACRGTILASVVGTLIGTPWTFPLMWWAAYKVGEFSFHLFGAQVVAMPADVTWHFLVDEITHRPMDIMIPWIAGGLILMMLTWPIFYILGFRMVKNLRHTYKKAVR